MSATPIPIYFKAAKEVATRLRNSLTKRDQLLMSADQVFSISLTTESGIGM